MKLFSAVILLAVVEFFKVKQSYMLIYMNKSSYAYFENKFILCSSELSLFFQYCSSSVEYIDIVIMLFPTVRKFHNDSVSLYELNRDIFFKKCLFIFNCGFNHITLHFPSKTFLKCIAK